ncbi:Protein FAR1-like sequence 6 [Apostasia shenzhenica]|uniref:Protein FAR1-RELATED SEQUENCE n=1 Tax=Apostasia shenzhenica TaxID=1088818 RepID=A0A2I0AZA9_9ASPA|nr:Protein FAR1-like sequence 6 [Apostasia shenzhenica]
MCMLMMSSVMETPDATGSEINEEKINEMNGAVLVDNEGHQEMVNGFEKEETKGTVVHDSNFDVKTPCIGMTFKTYDEVSNFYKQYALHVGFGVTVKKSWFSKSGVCRRLILVCSRGGSGRADACYKARLTAKTNCEAMVGVRMWDDGLLHIVETNLEHNHPVSPSTAQSLRCYQKMLCKVSPIQSAGHRNSQVIGKDCGYAAQIGRLKLGEEDAAAIHEFFARMQNNNPNFFYSVDLDQHGRMRNLFWADARSREASRYFADVCTLDSSCLTENYDLPLVVFSGMNQHGQIVLLGCGLLSNENVETYIWLFRTWLTCIASSHPNAFITDDCKAIQNAIVDVFPEIRHRLCLFHIFKKFPDKLKGSADFMAIRKALKKIVYNSLERNEFEEKWMKTIGEYGLQDNEWLNALYENRHSWVPLFLKDTFWAGMSVAQRGESLTSYFDGFVFPRTTIKQFLGKYETIIQSKYKKESQSDSESFHKAPLIVSKYYMEEQLSKLYTLNMFKKFQDELKATMYCHASPIKIDGPLQVFEVKECSYIENGRRTESKDHEVCFNLEDLAVHCICGFFQFNGILCRHSLSVFKLQQVFEIPPQYILDRWKKDCKRLHRLAHYTEDVMPNNILGRYDYLSRRFLQLVEIGFLSEERFQVALKLMRELEISLLDDLECRDKQPRLLSFETQTSQCIHDLLSSQFGISKVNKSPSSLHAKRRGRPPKKIKEANVEMLVHANKEQDFLRSSLLGNDNHILQASSAASHLDAHAASQGGIDLMEEVNPNDMSFGTHFGVHVNHQHLMGGQESMQQSHLMQTKYDQQAFQNPARMQWLYQQNYQEAHIARRTG